MMAQELEGQEDVKRSQVVLDFVNTHQFCMGEDIVMGLEGILSRGTIYKILKRLTEEGLLLNEKPAPNSRNNRFHVASSNPFIIARKELAEFENHFFQLLEALKTAAPEMFHFSRLEDLQRDKKLAKMLKQFPQVPHQVHEWTFTGRFNLLHSLIAIFHAMMDRMLFLAKGFWGPSINDRKVRSRLFELVFTGVNDLEERLLQGCGNELRPHVERKFNFWEREKLYSIYDYIKSDMTLFYDGPKREYIDCEIETLVGFIKLPDEVQV